MRTFFKFILKIAAITQLRKIGPKHIIGITGSAGKTSGKLAIAAILKEKCQVKAGTKSQNTEYGIPLDILNINLDFKSTSEMFFKTLFLIPIKLLFDWKKYEIYIVEMGVDSPNDMAKLLKIVRPDIGVFLNVLPVHTANFDKNNPLRNIANEKGKLVTSLPKSGYAILNKNDKEVIQFKTKTAAGIIEFTDVKIDIPGFAITNEYHQTFAAAIACSTCLGFTTKEAISALVKNYKLPPGRMSLFKGIKNTSIIDSTYNASPETVISALNYLKAQKAKRKIAVLGDMRELGYLEEDEHKRVAIEAVKSADHIFTLGPLMKRYFYETATKNSKKKEQIIKSFENFTDLVAEVENFVQSGDLILVKGSQNTIFLERLVEALLDNKSDIDKLCRRGIFWDRKRDLSK